jgi:hypothetical protein
MNLDLPITRHLMRSLISLMNVQHKVQKLSYSSSSIMSNDTSTNSFMNLQKPIKLLLILEFKIIHLYCTSRTTWLRERKNKKERVLHTIMTM